MTLEESSESAIKAGEYEIQPVQILQERSFDENQKEYLVKFCAKEISTATSPGSEPQQKDVLLWLTKSELDANYGSLTQQISNAPSGDGFTDEEDLLDMKEDVKKLMTRVKRQLHNVKEEGDHMSIGNIRVINTLKVLSTYAGLGMLSKVFREIGALELILELLWSKSSDMRKSASEMLKALATHDSASRAYVLLSLTKSEDGKHDFDSRNTVLKMFADTCSNEEASSIPADIMQFPQVLGRSLFKLMKCYLKVNSLLEESEPSAPEDRGAAMLERSFAVADLIYELSSVMGWRMVSTTDEGLKPSKNVPKFPQVEVDDETLSPDTSAAINVLQTSRLQSIFGPNNSSNPLNTNLLSKLISDSYGSSATPGPFKPRSNFDNDISYAAYVSSVIRDGSKVRIIKDFKPLHVGDQGYCVNCSTKHRDPTIHILGENLNVPHKFLEIITNSKHKQTETSKQDFYKFPHKSKLWKRLASNLDRQNSSHPYATDRSFVGSYNSSTNLSDVDWLEIVFLIEKLPAEQRESVRNIITQDINNKLFEVLDVDLPVNSSNITPLFLKNHNPTFQYFVTFLKNSFKLNADVQKHLCQSQKCYQLSRIFEKEEKQKAENASNGEGSSAAVVVAKPDTVKTPTPEQEAMYSEEDYEVLNNFVDEICSAEMTRPSCIAKFLKCYDSVSSVELESILEELSKASANLTKIAYMSKFLLRLYSVDRITETKEILIKLRTIIPTETDRYFYIVWLATLNKILMKRYDEYIEVLVATTGCLATVFEILRKYHHDTNVVKIAIQCLNLSTRAVEFAQHVDERLLSQDDAVSIRNSLMSVSDIMESIILPVTKSLTFILDSIDVSSTKSDWTQQKWYTLEGCYYAALCICSFITCDHTVLAKLFHEVLKPIADRGAQLAEMGCPAHQMSLRCPSVMKAFIGLERTLRGDAGDVPNDEITSAYSLIKTNEVYTKIKNPDHVQSSLQETTVQLQDSNNDGFVPPTIQQLHDSDNNGFASAIQRARSIARNLENQQQTKGTAAGANAGAEDVLKLMEQNLTDESFDDLHDNLKQFRLSFLTDLPQDMNFSIIPQCMKLFRLLLEKYYDMYDMSSLFLDDEIPTLLKALLQLLDVTSSPNFIFERDGATRDNVEEVVRTIIDILHLMCKKDRDVLILLTSMDAESALVKASQQHMGVVGDIVDLTEMFEGLKSVSEMHSKILSLIVGGSITVALSCMEDARRRKYPLNIPFFQHLLSSLSKGSDSGHKDDKCWEQMEVSSNSRYLAKLTDGNPSTYWESNGSSGGHWIQFHIKKGIVLRKVTLFVSPSDSSYMPSRVAIFGGLRVGDISTELNQVPVSSTDKSVVLLENEHRHWPYIKISIRRCQQGGIDTRVRGVTLVGPRPSFWPVLHDQVQLRCCLSYGVMVRTWIAEALRDNSEDDMTNHKILLLPKRLIEFIQHEQSFANNFLPNQHSADLIGLYIKQSMAAPLVKAVLTALGNKKDKKCLYEKLLSAYLRHRKSKQYHVFCSRMRVLSRLLVDICNVSDNTDNIPRKQINHVKPESIQNKNIYTPKEDKNKTSSSVPEPSNILVQTATNSLDKLPVLWKDSLTSEMLGFIKDKITKVSDPSVSYESFCNDLLVRSSRLSMSCRELFGSSPLFLNGVVFCVMSAVFTLTVQESEKFCLMLNLFIHDHLRSSHDSRLNELVKLLSPGLVSDVGTIFETQYCLLLGERLNCDRSASMDMEFEVCNSLQLCFHNNQPQMMLYDIVNSKTLWNHFISNKTEWNDTNNLFNENVESIVAWESDDSDECEMLLSVTVLSPMLWRIPAFDKHAIINRLRQLHPTLHQHIHQYKRFFNTANHHISEPAQAGESLFWTAEGHAVVLDTATGQQYTVTTPQMMLLLQFNIDDQKINIDEWRRLFPSHQDSFSSLGSVGLLRSCEENVVEITTPSVQDKIIDVQPSAVKRIMESCGSVEAYNSSKRSFIDCLITKVLKSSSCTYDDLVYKVMKNCRDHFYAEHFTAQQTFLPRMTEIRSQIQYQIDNDLIHVDPERPQVLHLFNEKKNENNNYDSLLQLAKPDGVLVPPTNSLISSLPTMPAFWKSSKSLTKQDVTEMMAQHVRNVQETLAIEEQLADVLLQEYDYNEAAVIEKYLDNKDAVLTEASVQQSPVETTDTCPVCLLPFTPSSVTTLLCGHQICNDCLQAYLQQKLHDNKSVGAECPNVDCHCKLSQVVFRTMFSGKYNENYERYEDARLRQYVECKRSLSWCHNPIGCDRVVQKGSGQSNVGLCTHCGHETCFACTYVESHFPASCGQMSQWMEDGGFYDGMASDARSKHLARIIAKRCPNCQSNIEKDDGCLHMKCAKCQHDFCWRCLKPWRPTHKDYYKCAAKMSKLAHKNSRFLEHNRKCEYHHMGKVYAASIMYRLVNVQMDDVDTNKYMLLLKLTMTLINARKILAYCNVFSFYSVDAECIHAIHVQSVALENMILKIQIFIEETLTKFADLRYAIESMNKEDCQKCAEMIIDIKKQFNKLQIFSMQGLKVSSTSSSVDSSTNDKPSTDNNQFDWNPSLGLMRMQETVEQLLMDDSESDGANDMDYPYNSTIDSSEATNSDDFDSDSEDDDDDDDQEDGTTNKDDDSDDLDHDSPSFLAF